MQGAKSFEISRQCVWQAYQHVKANKGSAGVDGISIQDFEKDLKSNLYKLWNRLSSGSYMPPAVKLVEIPKGDGKKPEAWVSQRLQTGLHRWWRLWKWKEVLSLIFMWILMLTARVSRPMMPLQWPNSAAGSTGG